MKRYLFFLSFVAIITSLVIPSCEYHPDGENFREISMPDSTGLIYIELTPYDTNYIFTIPVSIHYDLNTFDLKVHNVRVFLDDIQVFEGTSPDSSFIVDPGQFETGDMILTLAVTTNTNSSSLADLLGWESFVFMKQWDVHVDGRGPDPFEITRIFNDSGLLKLEWESYHRLNFQKYRVYTSGRILVKEITDPAQNFWEDSSYVGGLNRYVVEIVASNKYSESPEVSIDFPYPAPDTLWLRGDSALIWWPKHPFYRALEVSLIVRSYMETFTGEEIFYSTNPNDTSFLMRKIQFGNTAQYTLLHRAKKPILPYWPKNSTNSKISFGIGRKIPMSMSAQQLPLESLLYLQYYDSITKITIPGGQKLLSFNDSYKQNWIVTPDDKNIFFNEPDVLIKHDASTFDILGTSRFTWPEIVPNARQISNNGTAIIWLDYGLGLYDYYNNRYIFTNKNNGLEGAAISPDGRYTYTRQPFIDNSADLIVNQVANNGLIELWKIPVRYSYKVAWLQEGFSKLLVLQNESSDISVPAGFSQVAIYDPKDKSILHSFLVKTGQFAGIDTITCRMAVWDNIPGTSDKNKVYLYNYKTGSLDFYINLSPVFDNLLYFNGCLISGKGYCFDISEF